MLDLDGEEVEGGAPGDGGRRQVGERERVEALAARHLVAAVDGEVEEAVGEQQVEQVSGELGGREEGVGGEGGVERVGGGEGGEARRVARPREQQAPRARAHLGREGALCE